MLLTLRINLRVPSQVRFGYLKEGFGIGRSRSGAAQSRAPLSAEMAPAAVWSGLEKGVS